MNRSGLWCSGTLTIKEVSVMKRTTHRSSTGTKLYAVRDSKGRFVDIQTYKRAHATDVRKKGTKENPKKK
jgi:hypothetical protein